MSRKKEVMKQVEEVKLDDGKVLHVVPQAKLHEHKTVIEIHDIAVDLRACVMAAKDKIEDKVEQILAETAQEYGEKWKGNARLFTLDEKLKVTVKIQPQVKFDKEMALAKQKYDKWLQQQEASSQMRKLVDKTFSVNSDGNIPKSKLMTLRRFDSEDQLKKEADAILDKAKRKEIRKPYISVYQKDDDGNWERIKLNFSEV